MQVIDVKENNPNEVYSLFHGEDLTGRFSKWNGRHQIKEITIESFWRKRKIELVSYCEETDAIEIHYNRSSEEGTFKPVSFPLNNCRLNCIRVIVLEYDDNEKIKECSSTYAEPTIQPKSRKGNILVGNP